MTQEKAREYFSAYREGTLEPGLRASMDRVLKADPSLREEYDGFVAACSVLDGLKNDPIEIPFYLHDRITSRLESVQTPKIGFIESLRMAFAQTGGPRLALAGLAAFAFMGIGWSLHGMSGGNAATANMVMEGSSTDYRWTQLEGGIQVSILPSSSGTLKVTADGASAQEFAVTRGTPFQLTLKNPNGRATRFTVQLGSEPIHTIIVPGSGGVEKRSGHGDLSMLGLALSDAYKVPVLISDGAKAGEVRWTMSENTASAEAEAALAALPKHPSVIESTEGILKIGE